jgi:hypothetical protein
VKSLPNEDPKEASLNRLRRIRSYTNSLPFVFMLASLVASAAFDISSRSGIAPIRYLLICLAVTVLFTIFGTLMSDKLNKLFATLIPRTHILLTRGDENLCDKESKSRTRNLKMLYFSFTGIFVGFVVNIFSTYVASIIFS